MLPWKESSLWNVSDDQCTAFNRGEDRCSGLEGLVSFLGVPLWLPSGFPGDLGGVLGFTGFVRDFFGGGDLGGFSVESSLLLLEGAGRFFFRTLPLPSSGLIADLATIGCLRIGPLEAGT